MARLTEPARTTFRSGTVQRLAAVAAIGGAAAVVWIGAAALTVGRGFDRTDEGFYLLSYRWWDTNLFTFTGAQYLYGPVFEAIGYDIATLRAFRLVTVVATLVVFGWAFMRWLRLRRPDAPPSRLWEIAGVAAIVAGGGMIYSWLPMSPGYNDISALGALLAAAIGLRIAADVLRGRATPAWVPAVLGPVLVAIVLAKWPSGVSTAVVVLASGTVVLAPRGWREVLRAAGWATLGAGATLALTQVLLVPLNHAVPEMLAVNEIVAESKVYSPGGLIERYVTGLGGVLWDLVTGHALLLLAAVVAAAARRGPAQRFAAVAAIAGVVVSGWRLVADGGLHGGADNLTRFPITILLVLVLALLIGLAVVVSERLTGSRESSLARENRHGWAVLAMLLLLPLTQAAGTGNAVHLIAINAFAAWVAIIIAIATGIVASSAVARGLAVTTVFAAALLPAVIVTDGLWSHPYRSEPLAQMTAPVPGVPALDSVHLQPGTADAYRRLRERLQPYLEPEGRAMLGLDRLAGVILALDGRPVAESWVSDDGRSAAGIRAQCSDGGPWWGSREPILLFRRPASPIELTALRSCGLDVPSDYQLLAPKEETMGIEVYVPR